MDTIEQTAPTGVPRGPVPPPLPPRTPSQNTMSSPPPPPYSIEDEKAARAAILREHNGLRESATMMVQPYSLDDEKAARSAIVAQNKSQSYSSEDEKVTRKTIIEQTKSQDRGTTSTPTYSLQDEKTARAAIMDEERTATINEQWRSHDPRSSSTQSLVPSESGRDGRRTLLLIFIHGFMGNETSFQSFPAHLHNLLTITMAETHIVHTKIYPRYKSRKAIEFARDDFSKWLEPHENPITDVILLGHSMGGLLAAEVAILPASSLEPKKALRHRILGTISFDTPFLGMHPGVIISGIGSLFRPAVAALGIDDTSTVGSGTLSPTESQTSMHLSTDSSWSPGTSVSECSADTSLYLPTRSSPILSPTLSHTSSISAVPTHDPNYNPPFPNDVRATERKGWSSVLHFINKHSDGLTTATKQYFMSHIEFGGCLADYQGLKTRYAMVRSLEDINELARDNTGHGPRKQRVRFVNYYTASTGIPKKPKSPKIPQGQMMDKDEHLQTLHVGIDDLSLSDISSRSGATTPRIFVDEYNDQGILSQKVDEGPDASPIVARSSSSLESQIADLSGQPGVHDEESSLEMRHIDSIPIPDDEEYYDAYTSTDHESATHIESSKSPERSSEGEPPTRTDSEPPLPPIPSIPTKPKPLDLDAYIDKDSRKLAEKEQKRLMKTYTQAVKDRDNAIKDRKKLAEKREARARKDAEKQLKAEEKQRLKEEKDEAKRLATVNPEVKPNAERGTDNDELKVKGKEKEKPKRDKKFCMLPPENGGMRDPTWVRVYMEGVDEVGAHCGLFFPGPQYESLVGDVGAKVEEWVRDDKTRRTILEAEE